MEDLTTYSNYIADKLSESINYSEMLADKLNSAINYIECNTIDCKNPITFETFNILKSIEKEK